MSVPKDRIINSLNIIEVLKGTNSGNLKSPYFLYRGDAIRVGDWEYVKIKK